MVVVVMVPVVVVASVVRRGWRVERWILRDHAIRKNSMAMVVVVVVGVGGGWYWWY